MAAGAHSPLLLLGACVVLLAVVNCSPIVPDDSSSPLTSSAFPSLSDHASASVVVPSNSTGRRVEVLSQINGEKLQSVEVADKTKVNIPTMMDKLRDVKEGDDEERDNDAAEEVDDSVTGTSSVSKTNDDNDADEHDDYENNSDEYVDTLPLLVKKKKDNRVSLNDQKGVIQVSSGSRRAQSSLYDDGWPEMLPTPAARSAGAIGYQRDDLTYVVKDDEEYVCIMAYFKSTITVYYPVDGEDGKVELKSTAINPPRGATIGGTCDREEQLATLEITWQPGTFILSFAYDTITDSWYVDSFQFAFNSASPTYEGSNTDQEVLVSSEEDRRYWTTSHARSFRCMLLHDIPLSTDEGRFSATIHFDEVRVQALTYGDRFKTPKHCLHRVHRNEKVPFIVGCTLAGFTVLTVLFYAGMRYYKVKKVQYDTMH